MQSGWIKIHRKITNSPIFSSEKGLKIWLWLLTKANHKGESIYVGRDKVDLQKGQLVFGRKTASEFLKMSPSTVWFWIKQLKSDRFIDTLSSRNYTIITIRNWSKYQSTDSSTDFKKTSKKLQKDTNKNVKNDKNIHHKNRTVDNLCKDGDRIKLNDGITALRYFGQWVNSKNKSVKIDESYYPELKNKS